MGDRSKGVTDTQICKKNLSANVSRSSSESLGDCCLKEEKKGTEKRIDLKESNFTKFANRS
jgi:hypothetical protein